MMDVGKEIRIMHACETGATGVYRGHKCVARYFFRTTLKQLDGMRFHEREHSHIFESLLLERGARKCYGASLFFWGGLFYGFFIGLFGLRAIGTSTAAIEQIVDIELEESLSRLKNEKGICGIIKKVQTEEQQHKRCGQMLASGRESELRFISNLAQYGAYTAKYMAERL